MRQPKSRAASYRPRIISLPASRGISEAEKDVHAFIHIDAEHALRQARALDARRRSGQPIGPLHGLPVGIKDIFNTADYPTECGSALLKGRRPARDCTAVARLRAAGAVIIGKTVTTECAYFHPERPAIRTILNVRRAARPPARRRRWPPA